jgi:hypothetical protein
MKKYIFILIVDFNEAIAFILIPMLYFTTLHDYATSKNCYFGAVYTTSLAQTEKRQLCR